MKNAFVLLSFLPSLLTAQEKITYDDHIYPIFEQSCLNCHNPDKKKGDLDLSSYPALLAGGSGGNVALVGDGGSSKLYTVTAGLEEPVMPPEGDKIDKKAADLIRAWIDGGLLETKDSSAKKAAKPKFDLAVNPSLGKPDGPPPMPGKLSLDPAFVAPRAGLVKAMAASPWAPLIALTGQKQILLYHSETFRFLGSLPFPKGQPEALTFHPSGKYLLAAGGIAGKSGQAITWDITTGKELFSAGREFDSILAAAITPDLAAVAFGGPSRLFKVWDTRENQQATSIKKHTDWITALAASPDGKFFASGDRNGGIHVWDLSGNEIHALRDHQGGITALAFRADSKLLASTSEDGQLIIWNVSKGSAAKKIKAHNKGATALHYHRDGHLVTAGRDRVVKIFKPDFNEKTSFKNLPETITAVALSSDGKRLFTADYNGEVFAYDTSSNKAPITTLESNPPALQERLAYLEKKLTEEGKKLQTARSQMEKLSKARTTLISRIEGTKKALDTNGSRLSQQDKASKKNEQKLKELAQQIEKKRPPLAKARAEKKKIAAQVQTAREAIAKLKGQKKDTTEAEKKLKELAARKAPLAQTEGQLSQALQKLTTERTQLAESQKALRQQRSELLALINAGKDSLNELKGKLPPLDKQLTAPKNKLSELLANEKALREDITYWKQAQ